MKKFLLLMSIIFSLSIYAEDEMTVTNSLLWPDNPRMGSIYTLCIEGYKFAIFSNVRTVESVNRGVLRYSGGDQSSSMVQIINDEGNGIKCSKE